VEDGLPFINVSTIFQDSKGNLWSGGYGGLSKFDGISFTNYTPKEGLLNHSVTSISEDNQGNLWIGTINGINKFDGKIVASYTTKNGLISNSITASIKDSKGDLWFGTDNGISKLTGGTFINYSKKDGVVGNTINCFYQDKSGNIWIGTSEGISVYNRVSGKFKNYTIANGLISNRIRGISEDLQHNIWIATSNGLCKLSNNTFISYTQNQGLIDDQITSIIIDYKNVIWLGTNKGLVKFANEQFTNYFIRKEQNSNLISCLYQDYERNLWIGTYAGLFKYRGNPFVSYGILDGLTNSFIYGIIRDSKNTLWAGSQGGGLYRFENHHFSQFNKNGLKANKVSAIYEYTPGTLWLATDAGLRIYDGAQIIVNIDSTDVFRNNINCFYKDSKNNLWMGGNNEVFKYDGKKFTQYTFKARHENATVWTIIEDKSGIIWIGTYLGGLIKHDPSKGSENFIEYSQQLGLKNDSYLTSIIDKAGNLYFGSLDGVWMFNPSSRAKPVQFSEEDGMNSALVYSLTFGKTENEIWAGTNQGLSNINIAEYKRSGQKKIIPFGKEEGFVGIECNSNGNWVDEDGSIWFGTVYGITKYDPNEYIANTAESKTNITGFQLFYTDTVLTDKIHLTHNNNNITFTYSGICLTNPEKVKYSHILEGFEKKWSPASKERFATYSNLPPGTYTFKVMSSNNEGVWNKGPAHFTFTIDIPFWQTWWFLISASLLITTSLIFSIRHRVQKIKDGEIRKTELNKKIANIESQALRAQMNPHFIFNTLSSIQHYISNNNADAALKYLTKFAKLMRSIMDNSKQPMIPVAEEINALHLYLELEVMRFDKKFQYNINVDSSIDQNYDRIPSMLIQPYIENSIIHGLLPKEGAGKIVVALQKQGDTILCTIEDDGIGRKKSTDFKKNRVTQHKSRGMSITKERLDILNSSLNSNINAEIIDLHENNEATGTRVKLIIPLETNE
ncbi:MAG: histidine kinase, partial [Bacteroidetes bacterium]|nr:histidine kinase [Bacteroidota bacterium]